MFFSFRPPRDRCGARAQRPIIFVLYFRVVDQHQGVSMISANHVGISPHPLPSHPCLRIPAYEGIPTLLKPPRPLDENRNTIPVHGLDSIQLNCDPKSGVDPRLLLNTPKERNYDYTRANLPSHALEDPRMVNGLGRYPEMTSGNVRMQQPLGWLVDPEPVDKSGLASNSRISDYNSRLITPFLPPSGSSPYLPPNGTIPYPFYPNLVTQRAFPNKIPVDQSQYPDGTSSSNVTSDKSSAVALEVNVAATTVYNTPRISSGEFITQSKPSTNSVIFTSDNQVKPATSEVYENISNSSDTDDNSRSAKNSDKTKTRNGSTSSSGSSKAQNRANSDTSSRTPELAVHMPQPPSPPLPPHFTKGSMIRLANGELKAVELLSTEDFRRSSELSEEVSMSHSILVNSEKGASQATKSLTFSIGDKGIKVSFDTID